MGSNDNGPEGPFPSVRHSVGGGVQPLGRGVVVILQPILVAHHLAIELVHQLIDGGVKIFVTLGHKNIAPSGLWIRYGKSPK